MVKILPMDEILDAAERDPNLLTVLFPQRIAFFAEKYRSRCPENTVEILLPPNFGSQMNYVRPDYMMGVFDAVSHLIHLGHRRIAFLGDSRSTYRYAAYRIALEAHQLQVVPELVVRDEQIITCERIDCLLQLPEKQRPTAIFCASDRIAIRAMEAIRNRGLSIPDDISVIGFDDIEESATAPVPLSTVKVPYYEIGQAAVAVLMEKIKTGQDVLPKTIPAVYLMRKSVGPVKK